jgi:hypothetical protein
MVSETGGYSNHLILILRLTRQKSVFYPPVSNYFRLGHAMTGHRKFFKQVR